MEERDCIYVSRDFTKWKYYKDATIMTAYLHLAMSASPEDGSTDVTPEMLAKKWKTKVEKMNECVSVLKDEGLIRVDGDKIYVIENQYVRFSPPEEE